jgi:hypothetical protein
MCTKLVELFANRMVERRNMINSIYGGEHALRVLGGVLSLSFSLLFPWFAIFLCHLLVLWFFLLLDDLLELFLAFGLLVVLHVVLDSKFKPCAFVL